MARGSFVKVIYRTGAGVAVEEIEAMSAGADVEIRLPDRGGLFVTVAEVNQVGRAVRTARFLATEVLSIVEGQKPAQKLKVKK
jgi:hypothetical protein